MEETSFIKFQSYQGCSVVENALLSLIMSFSKSTQRVCFTNDYAAIVIGSSSRTISRLVSFFEDKGYITTYIDNGNRRYIYPAKYPALVDVNKIECELENTPTTDCLPTTNVLPYHDKMSIGDRQIDERPTTDCLTGVDKMTTNKKEDKKEEKKEHKVPAHTLDFNTLFSLYPSSQEPRCRKLWVELNEEEKKEAIGFIEIYDVYLNGGSRKPLYFYLEDKEWTKPKYSKHIQSQRSTQTEQTKIQRYKEQLDKLFQNEEL